MHNAYVSCSRAQLTVVMGSSVFGVQFFKPKVKDRTDYPIYNPTSFSLHITSISQGKPYSSEIFNSSSKRSK